MAPTEEQYQDFIGTVIYDKDDEEVALDLREALKLAFSIDFDNIPIAIFDKDLCLKLWLISDYRIDEKLTEEIDDFSLDKIKEEIAESGPFLGVFYNGKQLSGTMYDNMEYEIYKGYLTSAFEYRLTIGI
jgi:hypothetical protein